MLFAQVREDPNVELSIINKLKNPKILCVTSGGCTILSLLSENISHIDAIDVNTSQNYLCELKAAVCNYYNNIDDILAFYQGKTNNYDKVMEKINLSDICKNYWLHNIETIYFGINRAGKFEELFRYLVESKMDFKKAFDRSYLIKIFGENAVQNSKYKEFYDHFSNIISIYQQNYKPEDNYFYYQILNDCYPDNNLPYYLTHLENLKYTYKIKYIVNDYLNYIKLVPDNYYDLVQTSNLTDWIEGNKLNEFINTLYRIVKPEGYIVMRRLNGDYKLSEIITNYFTIVESPVDKSHFYSEVIVAKK